MSRRFVGLSRRPGGRWTAGGGGEFHPSDLASYFADYDADLGVETTTGVPATDGQTVQRWLDQASGAAHLVQNTLANRPTYETDDGPNGHARMHFTAASITRMEATMSLAQPSTIFLVGRSPFSATNMYFYDGTSTRQAAVKLSGNYSILAPIPACALAIPTADTWFLDEAEFNGASSSHRVDDGTPATGNAGTATLSNLRVGAGNTLLTAIALDGDIARFLIFNAVLSAGDKAKVRTYLGNLYGLTV